MITDISVIQTTLHLQGTTPHKIHGQHRTIFGLIKMLKIMLTRTALNLCEAIKNFLHPNKTYLT